MAEEKRWDTFATITDAELTDSDTLLVARPSMPPRQIKAKDVLSGKQSVLTNAQMAAVNSKITEDKVKTYDDYASSKQDRLSSAQLSAVDSGITADKVKQYDSSDSATDIGLSVKNGMIQVTYER